MCYPCLQLVIFVCSLLYLFERDTLKKIIQNYKTHTSDPFCASAESLDLLSFVLTDQEIPVRSSDLWQSTKKIFNS